MRNNNLQSKILIVDDQPKNIQVLGSLLRQHDFVIGVAMNGNQALEALRNSSDYDLILLDVNMPDMNGYQVCREIRKNKTIDDIPVVFLTALAEVDNVVEGFDAGGQDYLTKPFNSQELLARVNTQLELKHSRDKLKHTNRWLEKEVHKRTAELNDANQKLIQLDKAKTEFLNIINHEIRTPLIGIKGAIGLIQYLDCPEEVKEMLDILDESSARLEDFSYKALDITHFNTKGKNALYRQMNDIYEIIDDLVFKKKDKYEAKKQTVNIINMISDTYLNIDRAYLDKCFSNILDNAIKFGKEDTEIKICLEETEEMVFIKFEDEGEKFPKGYDINRISPFETKSHIDHNPALSLFLSKLIIEAHEGSIEISNTEKGAQVTLSMPKVK